MAILGSIRPVAIILAPSVGGLLGAKFGWRSVFLILTGWGVFNIVATQLLLTETLSPKKEDNSSEKDDEECGYFTRLWMDTKVILSNRESLSLILTMSLLFSAPSSMLSNIAFLLQGYGLHASAASLLIGSLPCMMILAGGMVALCGKSPKIIMSFGMFSLFLSGVAAAVVGAVWSDHWLCFMWPLYMMVFSQSLFIPPGMSVYLQPWGEKAGFASGLMSFCRTFLPTTLAFSSTTVTAKYGVSGFLFFIATILFLANIVFCVMSPRGDLSNMDQEDQDQEEEDKERFVVEMEEFEALPAVSDGAWLLEEGVAEEEIESSNPLQQS